MSKPRPLSVWKFIALLLVIAALAIGLWVSVFWIFFSIIAPQPKASVLSKVATPSLSLSQEVELMTPDHQGHASIVRAVERGDLRKTYTTAKYVDCTDCDYNAIHNLRKLAEADLWPRMPVPSAPGGFARMPCGGSSDCDDPLFAPRVKCRLEVTDCNFGTGEHYQDPKVLRTLFLECRGDIACWFEHKQPQACCVVTKQIKGKYVNP